MRDERADRSWSTLRVLAAGALIPGLAFGGCAAVTCQPTAVVVAKKEERSRIDDSFRGVRTDEVGRLHEVHRFAVVPDYWVQSENGSWYRVSAEQFRSAEVGRSVEVCK